MSLGKWILLVVVCLFLVSGIWFVAIRWLQQPAEIISPENVRRQWEFAYNLEEDLWAQARIYCAAQEALALTDLGDQNAVNQRITHITVAEQNYSRMVSDYNARLRNLFEAGVVKPPDVVERAPSLGETIVAIQAVEKLPCGVYTPEE